MILDASFAYHLLISLAVGALIGLEREHHREGKFIIAGIRTFPLIAISGTICAFLETTNSIPNMVLIGFVLFGALAIAHFYIRHTMEMTGLTSTITILITYMIGVIIGLGFILEGLLIGVATTFLLLSKERLHHIATVLSGEEIMSALQFATIAFILLPLTYDMPDIGPEGWIGRGAIFDPFWVLLIVLFVSIISFASFLVMRTIGATKGLRYSGMLGGLVNSEATTVSLSNLACGEKEMMRPALVGIIFANATMFVRNLAICYFSDPSFSVALLLTVPFLLMALVSSAIGYTLSKKYPNGVGKGIRISSPFAIIPALRFALLFALISAGTYFAQLAFGDWGVFVIAIGGFVSSAAVTASVSTLAFRGTILPWIAAEVVLLSTILGVVGKIFLVKTINEPLSRETAKPLFIIGASGIVLMAALLVLKIVLF